MKKLILMASAVLLIVSCQKQNPTPTATTPSTTASDVSKEISMMTTNYVSTQVPNRLSDKWRLILGADCKGALGGAAVGAATGALIAGLGAGGGAIIGGLLGGAGASLTEAGSYPTVPGGTVLTPNPNNAYDFVGLDHYKIINDVYTNPSVVYPNGQVDFVPYFDFCFTEMESFGINAIRYKGNWDAYDVKAQTLALVSTQSFNAYVNSLSGLTNDEKSILNSYSTAFDNTTTSSTFGVYSVGVENAVTNSTTLPTRSKAILLSVMATARHGVAAWD